MGTLRGFPTLTPKYLGVARFSVLAPSRTPSRQFPAEDLWLREPVVLLHLTFSKNTFSPIRTWFLERPSGHSRSTTTVVESHQTFVEIATEFELLDPEIDCSNLNSDLVGAIRNSLKLFGRRRLTQTVETRLDKLV